MKKIYKSILLTMIAVSGLTACSDYEAPDIASTEAIDIVSRETTFTAAASTGTIKFEAKGPVTVSTSNEWITPTVDGDVINIAVAQNDAIDSRAGSITVKCGNATEEIQIIQSGIIFKFDDPSTIAISSDAWANTYQADSSVPVQISSDAEWLSGTIADGILTVKADRNTRLQPRTGVLTLTSGSLTYDITVNQEKLEFPLVKVSSLRSNDDEATYTYNFPADIEVKFTPSAGWIHGEFANETVTITLDANNTGHIRQGGLDYEVDGVNGSVKFMQADFDKDIAGSYYWFYTDPKDNEDYYIPATLKREDSNYSIDVTSSSYSWSIPVTYNDETLSINLPGGSYIGKYSKYFMYICYSFLDPEDNKIYYTWEEEPSMNASFQYGVINGKGYTLAEFVDAKTFNYDLMYLQFNAFTSQPPTGGANSNAAGYLIRMLNPMFQRVHDISGETTVATVASSKSMVELKAAQRMAKAKPAVLVLK